MILRLLLLPISVPSWLGCRLSTGMAVAVDRGVEEAVTLAGRLRGRGQDHAPSDRTQH